MAAKVIGGPQAAFYSHEPERSGARRSECTNLHEWQQAAYFATAAC